MKLRILALLCGALFVAAPAAANAAMFGKDETIHKIEDVPYEINQGEDLYLGYKTSIMYVLAGLYLSNDGYVLGVKSDSSHYYDLPTGDDLKSIQAQGLLPDPLPAYSVGWFDYVLGYSLWIVLVIVAAVYLIGWLRKRPAAVATPAGGGGPETGGTATHG